MRELPRQGDSALFEVGPFRYGGRYGARGGGSWHFVTARNRRPPISPEVPRGVVRRFSVRQG